MSTFRGVRVSKLRHVYGQACRREQCYESLSQCCAVNPKFLAVIVDVAGGGAFQVLPLKWTGKVDYSFGRVSAHKAQVTDLSWNPFNDNVLASASDDCTIKLWYVPDEGVRVCGAEPLQVLSAHSRRVTYIQWHPTASDVLASIGLDSMLLLWNVSTGVCVCRVDVHPDTIYSMSFTLNGNQLLTTCKDHMLRLIDARTGQELESCVCHEGSKASKVCVLGNTGKLVTTGFCKSSRRQMFLWDMSDLSKPLVKIEMDSSAGVLFPLYDADLHMLYVAGKGDGNIRYYEITDSHPFVHFLSEFQSRFPQRGLGLLPKRAVNVSNCEIFRLYKVHTTQALIEPITFIVPRKSDIFQADLYPDTAGATPALSADEWLRGMDSDPLLVHMHSTHTNITTYKPVHVKRAFDHSGQTDILVTSDRNNDKKFRFLSQVTKADYREVQEREDAEKLLKQQANLKHTSHNSVDNMATERTAFSLSPPPSAAQSPAFASAPSSVRYTTPTAASRDTTPRATLAQTEDDDCDLDEDTSADSSDLDIAPVDTATHTHQSHQHKTLLTNTHCAPARVPLCATVLPSTSTTRTKPGRIQCRTADAGCKQQTNVQQVRPFRVHDDQPQAGVHPSSVVQVQSLTNTNTTASVPPTNKAPEPVTVSSPKSPHDRDAQLEKLYAAQCRRVRELYEQLESKDSRIDLLETDVSRLSTDCDRLKAQHNTAKEDVLSLRYELHWKDERIAFLESQLSRLIGGADVPGSPSEHSDSEQETEPL